MTYVATYKILSVQNLLQKHHQYLLSSEAISSAPILRLRGLQSSRNATIVRMFDIIMIS
jgi:hypothetical protein